MQEIKVNSDISHYWACSHNGTLEMNFILRNLSVHEGGAQLPEFDDSHNDICPILCMRVSCSA